MRHLTRRPRIRLSSSLFACVVCLLACGGEPEARTRARMPPRRPAVRRGPPPRPAPAPPPARAAKIVFDRPGLAPVPMVHVTVAGQPTWMILDTGATTHAVSGDLARRGSLRQRDAGDGVEDHAGKVMSAGRADASSIVVDGWGKLASGGDLLVVEHAEGNLAASAGIGGTIAPTLLADGRSAVVVDLDRAELRHANEEDATRTLATRRHDLAGVTAASCHGVVSVSGAVEGVAVRLLVNTGASSSDVFFGSAAATALGSRSKPSTRRHDSVAGSTPVRVVAGTKLAAGAWSTNADLNLVAYDPDPACPADGDLGLDALRACVLVYGPAPGRFRARCGK
jgi:predicted aspartyl protease